MTTASQRLYVSLPCI